MRKAEIYKNRILAGILLEKDNNAGYEFLYREGYNRDCISLTMPVQNKVYTFDKFPPFFENLLMEGLTLEGLNKIHGIEKSDLMSQLIFAGKNLFGDIEAEECQ